MADVVEKEDINEALRLMEMSKQSLYEEETGSQYVIPGMLIHYTVIWDDTIREECSKLGSFFT